MSFPRAARLTRRGLLLGSAGLAVAACGADGDQAGRGARQPSSAPPSTPTEDPSAGDTPSPTPGAARATPRAAGVFPASVTHMYGSTTVPAAPQRIVIVGITEQDVVLQLGYQPVATTEWYGDEKYATWPWARKLLGDAQPTVLHTSDGFEFEKVAALRPDLIIGTNSGMTKGDYAKFSALAPTIAMPKGGTDYFSPWQDQVRLIAHALGIPEAGRKLVTDTRAAFAKVATAHPEFAGKTATFSQGAPYQGNLYVYPAGLNTQFLSYLGFTMTTGLKKYTSGPGTQALISAENVDLIDADVIVFATDSNKELSQLRKFGTFSQLDAVKRHRAIYTGHVLAGAIYFMTPLSLSYTLTKLTPLLVEAVGGTAPDRITTA